MIFYRKPFVLNDDLSDEAIKEIISYFRKGDFKKAGLLLKKSDFNSLTERGREEYLKLKKMLETDKAGIFAVLFVLSVIIYLFIDYTGI